MSCNLLIAGIDEAGRGCVIGPLVVAGVLFKKENLPELMKLGVRDSKLLTPKKREALYAKIMQATREVITVKLSPQEIDYAVECRRKLHKLNRLEAKTMTRIIDALKPDIVYVDAADVNADRFRQHIQENLSYKPEIVSEHKADKTYPVVSAASIIAKVERDKEIASLSEKYSEYGGFGTGYLADSRTTSFLKQWLQTHADYPDCVRRSWKPAKQIRQERQEQKTTRQKTLT